MVRPLVGGLRDAPADGVVLAEPGDDAGIAIGIGVNPWYGLHDPEAMAYAAVDEAIRNVVAVGADPDRVALLDNFSWGDPRRPSTLGELVAAVDGCCAAALAYRRPVRVRQGLAQQRVHRRRRAASLGSADAGDHRRRPRARRRPLRHPRPRSGRPRPVPARHHAARVRRKPPRPRARSASRRPARCRRPTPARPCATAICIGRSSRARALVPRPQRGRAGGGAGRDVHRRPARARRSLRSPTPTWRPRCSANRRAACSSRSHRDVDRFRDGDRRAVLHIGTSSTTDT